MLPSHQPLLAIGLARLSSMSSDHACQRLLLMMVQVLFDKSSLCCYAAGNLMRPGMSACMLPLGLRPPKGFKLCTYHRWFVRMGPVPEPYFWLLSSDRSMRRFFSYSAQCSHIAHQDGWKAAHGMGRARLPSLPTDWASHMAASRGRSGSHLILQMRSVPLSRREVNSDSSGYGWMMISPGPSRSLVVSGGRTFSTSESCSLGSTRISSEI